MLSFVLLAATAALSLAQAPGLQTGNQPSLEDIPTGCKLYFDGCNTCTIDWDRGLISCTSKACLQLKPASCLDVVIPSNCVLWFDGCKDCKVVDGVILSCTPRLCAMPLKPAMCLEIATITENNPTTSNTITDSATEVPSTEEVETTTGSPASTVDASTTDDFSAVSDEVSTTDQTSTSNTQSTTKISTAEPSTTEDVTSTSDDVAETTTEVSTTDGFSTTESSTLDTSESSTVDDLSTSESTPDDSSTSDEITTSEQEPSTEISSTKTENPTTDTTSDITSTTAETTADKTSLPPATSEELTLSSSTSTSSVSTEETQQGRMILVEATPGSGWSVGEYNPVIAQVGDTLVFQYIPFHDVKRLTTRAAFAECDGTDSIQIAGASEGTGDGATYTIRDEDPEVLYFACSYFPAETYSHCRAGQKVVVFVVRPSTPEATTSQSTEGTEVTTENPQTSANSQTSSSTETTTSVSAPTTSGTEVSSERSSTTSKVSTSEEEEVEDFTTESFESTSEPTSTESVEFLPCDACEPIICRAPEGCTQGNAILDRCGCIEECGTVSCDDAEQSSTESPSSSSSTEGLVCSECFPRECPRVPGCKRLPPPTDECGCDLSCGELQCTSGCESECPTEPECPAMEKCYYRVAPTDECGCVTSCGELVCEPRFPTECPTERQCDSTCCTADSMCNAGTCELVTPPVGLVYIHAFVIFMDVPGGAFEVTLFENICKSALSLNDTNDLRVLEVAVENLQRQRRARRSEESIKVSYRITAPNEDDRIWQLSQAVLTSALPEAIAAGFPGDVLVEQGEELNIVKPLGDGSTSPSSSSSNTGAIAGAVMGVVVVAAVVIIVAILYNKKRQERETSTQKTAPVDYSSAHRRPSIGVSNPIYDHAISPKLPEYCEIDIDSQAPPRKTMLFLTDEATLPSQV